MKKQWLVLALLTLAGMAPAATDESVVLNAYLTVAARYPALIQSLFQAKNDKVACQKVTVLDLTREAFENPTMGPKLAKVNPWVYRNFKSSFGDLKALVEFCHGRGTRAQALNAVENMVGTSLLETVPPQR